MQYGVEIAKEAYTEQARRLQTHGDDYAAAVERLRERGGRWGDDGLFAEIETAWIECRLAMLEAVPGIGGHIGGVSAGMRLVPQNVTAGEQASAMQDPAAWR
ncbi:hypothetical protein ACFFR3_22720 [Nonomuraea salmonea]|uniref:Uncharacterized protein n=1 Tax=Nonomuraea salmonea TaxID=46181 RepID=A0ABV5NPU9_9ACTN